MPFFIELSIEQAREAFETFAAARQKSLVLKEDQMEKTEGGSNGKS
jgi:hypothetical protein